jgi:hypothetical protein
LLISYQLAANVGIKVRNCSISEIISINFIAK